MRTSVSSPLIRGVWTLLPVCAAPVVMAIFLTGCMSLDLGRPFQPGTDDWVSQGGSSERQHHLDVSLSFPLEETWQYNARAGFGRGSPLTVEETVFVSGRNGQVHAISLTDGSRRGREEFGDSIEGTPVVTDSVLYVPVSWEKPRIVAHDFVKGSTRWERRGTAVEAGLTLRDNLLYAADVRGRVTAFNRTTGDTVWTNPSDSLVSYMASPVLAGDHLIAVDDRGYVRAIDARSGDIAWERSLGEPVNHTPAVLRETVYIPSARGTLWSIDVETGRTNWEFQTDQRPRRLATPAVAEHILVVPDSEGILRRLDPDNGHLVWSQKLGGPITAAPLLLANAVIVGGMDASVYGVDVDDGSVQWKTRVEGRIKSAPVLKDQHLIVLAEPSHVYAFLPKPNDTVAGSTPPGTP